MVVDSSSLPLRRDQLYIAVADEVMREAAEKATDRPMLGVVKGGKG
jgi:hypothetical protein